ncbi:MAG: sulfotransferase family 2 domain-containing protein [Bacteroidetes bacterium]|nr:sulfotransferase family 2 domain-containing protein [Bacteroidota bacterium]MCB9043136.1 sulfotransferase family 2 domain-containing protein [Chitinophagales bacterium]
MIHYNPNDILISIHIPKCGGTSLDAILQKWFGLGLHRHYFNTRSGALPEKARLKTWWGSLRKGVCVHGHFNARKAYGVFDYYPQAKQFITVLRDPLEHLISTYYYELKVAKKRKLFRNKKEYR